MLLLPAFTSVVPPDAQDGLKAQPSHPLPRCRKRLREARQQPQVTESGMGRGGSGLGLPTPKARPVQAGRARAPSLDRGRVGVPGLPTAPILASSSSLLIRPRTPSHFLPACQLPPLPLIALPGLAPSHYLLCRHTGWSRGWAVAEIRHEILGGTSLPPGAWTTSAWPRCPHPRGTSLDGHPLFTT